MLCRSKQTGPPGYSPGVGKFDSDIFDGVDNLYPGGPFDPLGRDPPWIDPPYIAYSLNKACCKMCSEKGVVLWFTLTALSTPGYRSALD